LKPPSAGGTLQFDPEAGGADGQTLDADPPVPCAPPVELPPPPSLLKSVPPPHAAMRNDSAGIIDERDSLSFGIETSGAPTWSHV
jgi:hypothetical protein